MRPSEADSAFVLGAHRRHGSRMWLVALLPVVLLAGLILVVVQTGPADVLKSPGVPPAEVLTFQRVELTPQGIKATVLNDGPDPVTIAQVQVDDAYWHYTVEPKTLLHLRRATLTIPYPWVEGETHRLKVLTSTGVVFEHEIAVAVPTPEPGWRYLGVFTLIGLYVGVVPVMFGLLWYPMVRRLGHRGLDFLLALTVGLLLFLLVDASAEGFEVAGGLPGSYQGVTLFVFSAIAAYLALEAMGVWLAKRSSAQRGAGWILALLIAVGIGLHNFGEGLAIGAAFALGEAALGSLLIIGFALHNTTEGLAIVVPLAKHTNAESRVPVRALVELGLLGGVPAIAGAWLGGFVYSQIWALVFLGFGVGAIAQVVAQILGQMARDEPLAQFLANRAVLAGLLAGFVVMYTTGMLIG